MLYDPKWETEVKADPFSLGSLIAWLEKQPADRRYCYSDGGACLLHSYFIAMGFPKVHVGGLSVWLEGSSGPCSDLGIFEDIPALLPHTFGAALKRARKLIAR